jgi:hypothetical protein
MLEGSAPKEMRTTCLWNTVFLSLAKIMSLDLRPGRHRILHYKALFKEMAQLVEQITIKTLFYRMPSRLHLLPQTQIRFPETLS